MGITNGQEKTSTDDGLVTVHSDPPLRRHRDRQPATPLKRRDVRAGNRLTQGAWQGQEQDRQQMQDVGEQ